MYKQCLSLVAGLAAAAVFALSPGTAAAQHRGGGHGGGGHVSSGRVGGGNWRGGNWGGGGNWRGGNWGGRGWDRGWGWGGSGFGLGLGLGLGNPWYGGYGYGGYWPGYSNYGYSPYSYSYSPYSYDSYPYYGDAGSYSYGSPMYSDMSPSYSYGAPAPAQDNEARVRVIVPPDAKVWFGNTATQQTGAVRYFESPALTPGKDYSYDVKATWTKDGKDMTQTRHVDVRANAGTTVDFTRPMPKAGNSAAPNK